MIKVRMTAADGKPVFVFGLSHRNLHLLRQKKPITFDMSELGFEGHVLITAGKDEAAILAELNLPKPSDKTSMAKDVS